MQIESIAAGGEGVGRLGDGRAIFVHRTAPGELVEVALTQERPRWARGRLLKVLDASPARRTAPCPHFENCGGCTLEHLHYEAQLQAKSRIVRDALTRIGGLDPGFPEPEVVASPIERRYRNRVAFSLRRGGAGQIWAGFHSLHDPSRIVPISGRCLLPEEPISRVWEAIRRHWGPDANRLPAGERLRLTLRATSSGQVSLVVEGGTTPGRPEELIELVDGLVSIWHRPDEASSVHLAGSPGIPEVWGEDNFELSGIAFLQVNRRAADLLEAHVLEVAGAAAGEHIVDCYCGVGLHARRLARSGARVTGIELDREAVRIARSTGLDIREGRVEEILPSVLPTNLLILNPPRAGLEAAVVEAIQAGPPDRMIYVSCDPATLARDLKRLGNLYSIAGLRCFDLFPQTAHVETVVHLVRGATPNDSND